MSGDVVKILNFTRTGRLLENEKKFHLYALVSSCFSIYILSGSFQGAKNFQSHLILDKKIKVSYAKIRDALQSIPNWTSSMKRKYKFKRRHYIASHSNEKAEIDIAVLKDVKKGFHGFLLAIDIFNSFVYTFVLKKKDSLSIKTALKNLIEESGGGFEVITGDAEFKPYVQFLLEKKVRLQLKGTGQHCHLGTFINDVQCFLAIYYIAGAL